VDTLGGGECRESDAERVDGFVIATDAEASTNEIEGADGTESDDDSGGRAENDHLKREL
jgi:hypothetical protein